MTTYRVIALDPGGRTGWATYTATRMEPIETHQKDEYYDEKWASGTLGPEEHHVELYHLLEMQRVQNYTVVTESFEFRQGKQRDNIELISREYIGTAKTYCGLEGVKFIKQTAGAAKKFIPDKGPDANKKLRVMGLWVPGKENKHINDAFRHLVYYLVNRDKRYDLIECWRDLV